MNRKKIAVFVLNMYGAMIREMQEGLNEAALEQGIKLIYFAGFTDGFSSLFYDKYERYDEGDIVAFKLPDLSDFDGAIIIAASFTQKYQDRIDKILINADIPVVLIGGEDARYYNLINDEETSFSSMVEHVIEKHGCKDIYHVAGRKEEHFTYERIDAFKSILERHGLEYSDDRIYFGTLWRDCGEPALDYILNKCEEKGRKYPDAIVCVNDYSAIGIIDACRRRGIDVPGDIIVTGYDGIENAKMGYPTITTLEQPFLDVGKNSIYTFQKLWRGEKVDKQIQLKGIMIPGQSCGCVPLDDYNGDEIRQVYSKRMDKMEYLTQSTTNMILSISDSNSLEEVFKEIEINSRSDTGFDAFALCLAPDWDQQRVINDDSDMPDEEMTVVCGFNGDKSIKPQTFNRRMILPKELLEDPNPYYICSIHHLQYYMGYAIVAPTLKSFNQIVVKSWLVNLGAMLENWRIREKLNDTVDRLENLYNRDMLTGLYNRRGYIQFFGDIYSGCLSRDENLSVMVIDMDNLKYVNDNFGHNEGDYCLSAIAESMMVAANHKEICIRSGGDEFIVLAGDYSEDKAENYIKLLRENLNRRTKRDKKPYKLEVSIGACISKPEASDKSVNDISEEYLKYADAEMYKEKKAHKGL
ncbi:MAG: GGDEF domain-containing protein [Eubacterium sp.]|nr:GGDEF domain-containing protein [Eubacterium sp.]